MTNTNKSGNGVISFPEFVQRLSGGKADTTRANNYGPFSEVTDERMNDVRRALATYEEVAYSIANNLPMPKGIEARLTFEQGQLPLGRLERTGLFEPNPNPNPNP